jgi:hypothetical protein
MHGKDIESQEIAIVVKFEVFMAVTMKNVVL